MNLYKVGFRTENGLVWEEVKAGSASVEYGCLLFFKHKGSSEVIMAYKVWDVFMRAKEDV